MDPTKYESAPASVTIISIGGRQRCGATACRLKACLILKYADSAGRPIRQIERCLAHANLALGLEDGLRLIDERK